MKIRPKNCIFLQAANDVAVCTLVACCFLCSCRIMCVDVWTDDVCDDEMRIDSQFIYKKYITQHYSYIVSYRVFCALLPHSAEHKHKQQWT